MNWIKQQIEWVKSFLSEKKTDNGEIGKGSSKRLFMLLVISVFLIQYSKITWETKQLTDMPMNWSVVILCILGFGTFINYLEKKKK